MKRVLSFTDPYAIQSAKQDKKSNKLVKDYRFVISEWT